MIKITLEQIKSNFDIAKAIADQEAGFKAQSNGEAVIPPAAHLYFQNPPGDCHIKYGYVKGQGFFVVKVATGFPENVKMGLASGLGVVFVFSSKTGMPVAILEDRGYLTDMRTAIAGVIAAKCLAPTKISCIGIVGAGVQARLQAELLKRAVSCRTISFWARDPARRQSFAHDLRELGYEVELAKSIDALAEKCQLIVTTTSATSPLLLQKHIRPGTHITAVGADGNGKQELDAEIFAKSDICAVDSIAECARVGDSSFALKKNLIRENQLVEFGKLLLDPKLRRTNDKQITIADLCGTAVQDVQMAKTVLEAQNTFF